MDWMSVRAYQLHTGMTRADVLNLIYAGTLPAVQIGSRYKIPVDKADAVLNDVLFNAKDRPVVVTDEEGRAANAAVKEAGGFLEALKALRTKRKEKRA